MSAEHGAVAGAGVAAYPRWAEGRYCDPVANRFRQHPLDYLESMEAAVADALRAAGAGAAAKVRGIAVDTTGSTPVLADGAGTPLALLPAFRDDPDAMFVLWKDHTSVREAERINDLARSWGGPDYTQYVGGIYSSEWFWAKVLHILDSRSAAGEAAVTVLEHCDWIPAVLTGTRDLRKIRRSRCAAGHKAMWHPGFGGYPSDDFLGRLHPRLPALKATLGTETWTADAPFGPLSAEWAKRLGLQAGIAVAVGAFDAHMGAVGGGVRSYQLLKVMGTSTCDILVAPITEQPERPVPGICGQVAGSVLPGAIGYEAGQSAFGDIYAWFKRLLCWPLEAMSSEVAAADRAVWERTTAAWTDRIIPELERAALALPPGQTGLVALDWMNGRRTPDANQRLKGAIAGIQLGTDAPRIYRALVEATAFGSRAIVDRFKASGVPIESVIAIGGVARKSPFVVQTVADVLDMEVSVSAADQAVALGAAMFAATAAGLHPTVAQAQQAMSAGTERVHRPDPTRVAAYQGAYRQYLELGGFVEHKLTAQGE